MQKITIKFLEENFDEIIGEVEKGKSFEIDDGDGKSVMMIPYKTYEDAMTLVDENKYLWDHNDAS
jgi:hypothetical protein